MKREYSVLLIYCVHFSNRKTSDTLVFSDSVKVKTKLFVHERKLKMNNLYESVVMQD